MAVHYAWPSAAEPLGYVYDRDSAIFARDGLDINLMAQIWNEARKDPVAGPLACHLLQRLNQDPGNLFRMNQNIQPSA